MKSLAIVLLLASASTFAGQLNDRDASSLLNAQDFLNDLCRGGSGDDPKTDKACNARDKIGSVLTRNGWCYGEPGQAGFEMKWHKCKKVN